MPVTRWIVFASLGLLVGGCDRAATPPAGKPAPVAANVVPRNVLLITVDTTRADRIGCYGYAAAKTPAMDALAAEGALFERAYCQVPLTLPSHASILTGKYPRELGIRDNGRVALAREPATLAGLARRAGMKTAAFVSSFVLDSRFGLDRDFDAYDDDMRRESVADRLEDVERPADRPTDAALAWLNRLEGSAFFCWVHYYDPHDPYEPPAEYRAAHPDPYDGEIAFVDSQIQRLVAWLDAAGRRADTLVVIVGDHGESFGEHGVHGHAVFLHETNLRVPMIFAFPGGISRGVRVAETVEIAGLLPTLCDLCGWTAPEGLLSKSFAAALRGGRIEPQACYAESHYVHNTHGWAEQRALVTPKWKYISSTKPELFDLSADPRELENHAAAHPEVVVELRGQLVDRYEAMRPGRAQDVDSAGQRALQSLGYAAGSQSAAEAFLTPGAPDPKDMIAAMSRLADAQRLIRAGRAAEALPAAQEAAAASPGSVQFQYTLGALYVQLGRAAEALPVLRAAAAIDSRNPLVMIALGDALMLTRDWRAAAEHYATAAALDDADAEAHAKVGRVLQILGQTEDAIAAYRAALQRMPSYREAADELLALLGSLQRGGEAVAIFQELAKLDPESVATRFNLGAALLMNRQPDIAAEWFQQVLLSDPNHGAAYVKLGICHALRDRPEDAARAFASAKRFPDSAPDAWYNEGVAHEKAGRRAEALAAYAEAIRLRPNLITAIVALARQRLGAGEFAEAAAVLRAAAESCPDDVRVHSTLADLLSTCEAEGVRNGAEALQHARRACELAGGEHPVLLGILATAQAEVGDFSAARQSAERARALSQQSGDAGLVAVLDRHIAEYAAGRAIRKSKY